MKYIFIAILWFAFCLAILCTAVISKADDVRYGIGFDILMADFSVDFLPSIAKGLCSASLVRDPRKPEQILMCSADHCLHDNWLGSTTSAADFYLGTNWVGDFFTSKDYLPIPKSQFQFLKLWNRDVTCAPVKLSEQQMKHVLIRTVNLNVPPVGQWLTIGGFGGSGGPRILENCVYRGRAFDKVKNRPWVLKDRIECPYRYGRVQGYSGAAVADKGGNLIGVANTAFDSDGWATIDFSAAADIFGLQSQAMDRASLHLKSVPLAFGNQVVMADVDIDQEGRILSANVKYGNEILEATFDKGVTGMAVIKYQSPGVSSIIQRETYLNTQLVKCEQLQPLASQSIFSDCAHKPR